MHVAAAQAAGLVAPLVGEGPLTVLAPTDDATPGLVTVAFASVLKKQTVHSGVPGHYIFFGDRKDDAEFDILPCLAKFKEREDMVILHLEQHGDAISLIGLTVSKLKEFKPPGGKKEVDEIGVLSSAVTAR